MRILGITGGIATGKSTVTQMLADLGAPTLSADTLARDLLAPGTETTQAVLAAFPGAADPQSSDGPAIDRRALGRLIFADSQARLRLEALTHPRIIAGMTGQAALWKSQAGPCAALEIPLLFEAGLESLVDCIVVVACREETQIARLRARLGIDEVEARRQVAAQWPLPEKIARADRCLTTDLSLDDTRRQVQTFWNELCTQETNHRP